jgi:hypothetical protein
MAIPSITRTGLVVKLLKWKTLRQTAWLLHKTMIFLLREESRLKIVASPDKSLLVCGRAVFSLCGTPRISLWWILFQYLPPAVDLTPGSLSSTVLTPNVSDETPWQSWNPLEQVLKPQSGNYTWITSGIFNVAVLQEHNSAVLHTHFYSEETLGAYITTPTYTTGEQVNDTALSCTLQMSQKTTLVKLHQLSTALCSNGPDMIY